MGLREGWGSKRGGAQGEMRSRDGTQRGVGLEEGWGSKRGGAKESNRRKACK